MTLIDESREEIISIIFIGLLLERNMSTVPNKHRTSLVILFKFIYTSSYLVNYKKPS